MRILIVDDSARFRALLRALLAALSEDMDECEDGADAVEAYARTRPDIVLMDIRMKRMDGLAATRTLIAHDPSAKVVIVSSYDDEALRRAACQAGACAYAVKDDLSGLAPLMTAACRDKSRPSQP